MCRYIWYLSDIVDADGSVVESAGEVGTLRVEYVFTLLSVCGRCTFGGLVGGSAGLFLRGACPDPKDWWCVGFMYNIYIYIGRFGVLFLACAPVCRCRGCCSLSMCVCVCVTC